MDTRIWIAFIKVDHSNSCLDVKHLSVSHLSILHENEKQVMDGSYEGIYIHAVAAPTPLTKLIVHGHGQYDINKMTFRMKKLQKFQIGM